MPDIEVLAPVGNRAMLNAALAAGADAVFLGGKTGNARAFAGNFDEAELRQAVSDAHLQGVRVYLTLNTLVKNHEMNEVLQFADEAVNADIDAVILQDIGLACALKNRYPDLPLHASTQMNVHSLAGIREMERLGFERIIAGRETSLEELKRMRDGSSVEVELFVHGSLCVSLSGQCLLSGMIGGRSGNRGRCAQPCRKAYRTATGRTDTLLSLRDLNTLEYMDMWRDLGIASLKIEGRMKKPEYVFAVTKMVKAALRGDAIDTDLLDVSSRSFTKGFTLGDFGKSAAQTKNTPRGSVAGRVRERKGQKEILFLQNGKSKDTLFLLTKNGKELPITMAEDYTAGGTYALPGFQDALDGSEVRRIYAGGIESELKNAEKHKPQFPLQMEFRGEEGSLPELHVVSGRHSITVQGETPVASATNRPVERTDIEKRLAKVGNTVFSVPDIQIVWGNRLFIPLGEIGRMRQQALEIVTEKLARRHPHREPAVTRQPEFAESAETHLHIEMDDNTITDSVSMKHVSRVYTSDMRDLENRRGVWKCEVYGILPEPADKYAEEFLAQYAHLLDGVLVKDIAGAGIAADAKLPVHLDASVHCMNDRSAACLLEEYAGSTITASLDLSGKEMEGAAFVRQSEVIAFGPVVAMKLRQCPFAIEKGCVNDANCASCGFARRSLSDDHGTDYFVERAGGLSYLYFNAFLNRIENLAQNRDAIRPAAYRLILRKDPNNRQLLEYAADRLLYNKDTAAPRMARYWHTAGSTDGRWKTGVE